MKWSRFFITGFYLFCLLCNALTALSQEPVVPRPSPLAIASIRYNTTYLKVTYSQPHKNNRDVFGKLVPFGKIWRTGANEATEITVTQPVLVNSLPLNPGTYSLFTIPEKEKWTIIINGENGLWGSYNHNEALDILRFEVPAEKVPGDLVYEAFTIKIDHRNEMADLLLLWDKTSVRIPVKLLK